MLRMILALFPRPAALALLLALMVALSAAERLSCLVSPWPGGLFRYELRPAPTVVCQDQCWEDQNNTVLTRGRVFDPDLVHNVSRDALVLRRCLSHAHFFSQCHGFAEAFCSFDCSSGPTVSNVTNPSNNVCFGARCFEITGFALTSVTVLMFLLFAIAAVFGFYKYKTRRGQRDLTRRVEELQELQEPLKSPGVVLQELVPLGGSSEPLKSPGIVLQELVPLGGSSEPLKSPGVILQELVPLGGSSEPDAPHGPALDHVRVE